MTNKYAKSKSFLSIFLFFIEQTYVNDESNYTRFVRDMYSKN